MQFYYDFPSRTKENDKQNIHKGGVPDELNFNGAENRRIKGYRNRKSNSGSDSATKSGKKANKPKGKPRYQGGGTYKNKKN